MRVVRIEMIEHENKWRRRRLVVFGRSIPLATAALAMSVVIAAAWGGYLLTQTSAKATISVADAPVALNIGYPAGSRYCQINSGNGAASGSWVSPNYTCTITGFDDTTVAEWGLGIQNNEAFVVNLSVTLPVDTACVNFSENTALPASIGAGASTAGVWRAAGIAGPSGTLSCAGTSVGDFSVDIEISD